MLALRLTTCPACGGRYYTTSLPVKEDPFTFNTCPSCDEAAYARYMALVPDFESMLTVDTAEIEIIDFYPLPSCG